MKQTTAVVVLMAVAVMLAAGSAANAAFLQPSSASSDAADNVNTPAVLISDATDNGGTAYDAGNPDSGGDPPDQLSWFTLVNGVTPVKIFFDFSGAVNLEELYMWDYNTVTPTQWTLNLYDGSGQTGSQLLNYDFSISPYPNPGDSYTHTLDIADTSGVLSGELVTRNNSQIGVGLAEFGFTGTEIPEPATVSLLLMGAVGLIARKRRK